VIVICLEGIVLGGYRALQRVDVDWSAYASCRICLADMGAPCVALSGRVAGGRPDGVPVVLEHAHSSRRFRRGR
jgi:hypothetical protein